MGEITIKTATFTIMSKGVRLANLFHISIYLLAFSLPFSYLYSSIAIGVLVVCWCISGNVKSTFQNLVVRKWLWVWFAFFLLHVISYFYSQNKGESLFDIENKLSFLILPLIVGAGFKPSQKELERIFVFFITGVGIVALYYIARGINIWLATADPAALFYHNLIDGHDANAVYHSWYVLMSLSALLLFKWKMYFQKGYQAFKYCLIGLQVLFYFLLASKLLIVLFFVLLIPMYIVRLWRNGHISKSTIGATALLSIILILVLALTDNPIKKRYTDIINTDFDIIYLNDYTHKKEESFSNLALRMMVWRFGIENMNEHKLWLAGAGNGDVIALQNAKFTEYKFPNFENTDKAKISPFKNVNLHNMYMQVLLMLGIIGLLVFIVLVFSPLFAKAIPAIQSVYLIFLPASAMFFLQESALQTHAGILYYTFFISVFWATHYSPFKKNVT